jgi:hypothetical protein
MARYAKKISKISNTEISIKKVIFFATLIFFMIFSLIIPLRPTFSEVEKRQLTPFPDFSLSDLATGEYFRDIEDWFADTFPQRDLFVSVNTQVKAFYGIKTVEIHGTIVEGDEIPDSPFA